MGQPKIMIILGTRPEAVKLAPVIHHLEYYRHELKTCIVATAQHRLMLDQVLEIFHIEPDHDLDLMLPNQSLAEITVRTLSGLDDLIRSECPDLILVQGDTTTALVGGLAAFYHQIPIGHVEAGLRTGSKYNPFPEEINRHFLDVMADLCYAPTQSAKETLLAEGIPETRILVTGNTVVDALLVTAPQLHEFTVPALRQLDFRPPHRTLLVTAHRRESLGAPLRGICLALRDLVVLSEELQVVFPVHLNPKVREIVWPILGDMERVRLIEPVNYPDFVHLMKSVDLIMSDSGGVQEEAPTLGVPVLVIRDTTERPEGIDAGAARLVGTNREEIIATVLQLLDNPNEYRQMQRAINPYGDGNAAERIVDSIRHFFGLLVSLPMPFQAKLRQPNSIKI